jgi:3-methyladenine DNA glycosylase/8-oxoguanine DNA glycosylase
MLSLHLKCPVPFSFRDVVFSHGWLRLAPYHWEEDRNRLSRREALPGGGCCTLALEPTESEAAPGVLLSADAPPEAGPALLSRARWMLALDDDLSGFHALCREDPGLRYAAEQGQGRLLRSPTVWEDAVKTLLSVNTTWRQTVATAGHLVTLTEARCGGAFPPPESIAAAGPDALRAHCRLGYRADWIHRLAVALAEGSLDLEALKDPTLPEAEVAEGLRGIRGFGPYAVAHLQMLLGRYDVLPLDSWLRATVRQGWFGGEPVADRAIAAAFERYRPYRSLAFRFYDWNGALRKQVWTAPDGAALPAGPGQD